MTLLIDHKNKTIKTILIVCTILVCCFIWGHSLMSGEISDNESSSLYEKLKPVFDFIFGQNTITHSIFRKMAHFSEFCLLGFLLKVTAIKPATISLLVAIIDEFIQFFIPGRSASIIDISIDFAGAITGIILMMLLVKMTKKQIPGNDF